MKTLYLFSIWKESQIQLKWVPNHYKSVWNIFQRCQKWQMQSMQMEMSKHNWISWSSHWCYSKCGCHRCHWTIFNTYLFLIFQSLYYVIKGKLMKRYSVLICIVYFLSWVSCCMHRMSRRCPTAAASLARRYFFREIDCIFRVFAYYIYMNNNFD
jgi:hypothetical protein